MAELGRRARPNWGAGCRAGDPKRVKFFLHMLKNRVAELKGLGSLVTEHIQVNEI